MTDVTSEPWTCDVLRAGSLRLDGGGMFGIIPKSMWSSWVEADDANRIDLQTNCLLLRRGGRTVLVETGCGDKWSEKERAMYALERRTVVDALREHDVDPAAIDTVIVTHLHFDHAGGLTTFGGGDPTDQDASPSLVFPNAEIVVQRREWEDALANRSTMTRTYLRSHLDPIAERVRLVDGVADVAPGIRVEPLPGHTPGQQGVFVETTLGTVVFPGDLLPTIHHAHHSAATAYDMEPYETMLVKRRFLERAIDESLTIVLDHEPGEPSVRAVRDDRGRITLVQD
jgi:glyoxylase-like metal-dependent hydrolase (beta-lactamase superfamily II)